jgi:hypothetical protein
MCCEPEEAGRELYRCRFFRALPLPRERAAKRPHLSTDAK